MLNPASGKFDGMRFMNATTTAEKIAALQEALIVKRDAEDCVYEYVIECEDVLVEKDNYLKFAAVIPGGEYGRLDIFLFVEDQDGEKEKSIVRLNETTYPKWCDKVQSAVMHTNMVVGEQQVYTATIENQSLGNIGVEGFTVVNPEELLYVLKFMAQHEASRKLKITTWGDNVELTQEIYDALTEVDNKNGYGYLRNLELYIDGKITIPAGVPANAIDLLANDGFFGHITTVINNGNQVLTKGEYHFNIVNNGTITEAETADVTIKGNVTNTGDMNVTVIEGNVDNKGNIVAVTVMGQVCNGKYYDERRDDAVMPVTGATATIGNTYNYVRNWGTLNLNNLYKLNQDVSIQNYGILNLKGGDVAIDIIMQTQ